MAGEQERWEHLVLAAAESGRLGELGGQGWALVAAGEESCQPVLYLRRRAPDFRERVTLEQRARVYERLASGDDGGDAEPEPKAGILHPGLAHLLASTGHTDWFTVCDRGFPVPLGPERIDLALVAGIPTVLDVLRAVHAGWAIDRVLIAEEMAAVSPGRVEELRALLGAVSLESVSHLDLKRLAAGARATVRTGDTVPYANVIMVGG